MKVGTRIIASFAILGVFIIIASILGVRPIETNLREIRGFHSAALYSIQSLNSKLTGAVEESFAYVVSGDANEKEEFLQWVEHFKQNADAFYDIAKLDLPGKENEKALFDKIVSEQSVLVKNAKTIFEEYEETGAVSRETFQNYEEAIDLIIDDFDKLVKIKKEEVEDSHQIALDIIDRSENTIYGVALVSLILAVGLGFFVSKTISNPLLKLQQGAVAIGRGEFTTKIEIRSHDEIGSLADSFNKMANDLLETTVTKDYVDNIIENLTNCLVVLSPEGKIKSVNRATLNLLGYKKEELINQTMDRILEEDIVDLIGRGEIRNIEQIFWSKDGMKIPIIFSASILRDKENKLQGMVTVAQDITNQKKIEREREELIEELENKNAEMEEFTYTVSHDLKSPLITIGGFVALLEKDAVNGDSKSMKNDITRINKALSKMKQQLDELLNLSRISRVVNPFEEISMLEIVNAGKEQVAGEIKARGVEVKISPDMPSIFGDKARVLNVMQNLIGNAITYMGSQEKPLVEIGSREENGEMVIFVKDNGMGIHPRYHQKVFGLFERLDHITEGTGIGLSIVKRIVEFHGGRIWIESEGNDGGCTFCFTLPPKERSLSHEK